MVSKTTATQATRQNIPANKPLLCAGRAVWDYLAWQTVERSPAEHTKAQIVWQRLLPVNAAQILRQPNARFNQKCCLVGSNQGWVSGLWGWALGRETSKRPSLTAKGGRNSGSKNDEAASSYQHLLLTAGKIEEWPYLNVYLASWGRTLWEEEVCVTKACWENRQLIFIPSFIANLAVA